VPTLIFIDTNIWLDFYRVRGRQGDLSILEQIDRHHDALISTVQVEMEFSKNRQRVILEAYAEVKPPNWSGLSLPAFLAQSRQSGGLGVGRKKIEQHVKALRTRTQNMIASPSRYDRVYQSARRLFRNSGPHRLTRNDKERHVMRRLAWKRFILGYPPRKATDTSLGDAINWEWIIACAAKASADIVIVSRDSDFGVQADRQSFVNDWLGQEFRERVGRRRNIHLTDRLSEAFKLASIRVTRKQEQSEREFLESRPSIPLLSAEAAESLEALRQALALQSERFRGMYANLGLGGALPPVAGGLFNIEGRAKPRSAPSEDAGEDSD